jgi:hypothetical protein
MMKIKVFPLTLLLMLFALPAVFAQAGVGAVSEAISSVMVVAIVLIILNIFMLAIAGYLGVSHKWANYSTVLVVLFIGFSAMNAYVQFSPETYGLVGTVFSGGFLILILLAAREFVIGLKDKEWAKRDIEKSMFKGVRGGKRFGKKLTKAQAEEMSVEKERLIMLLHIKARFMGNSKMTQYVSGELHDKHGLGVTDMINGMIKVAKESYLEVEEGEARLVELAESEEDALIEAEFAAIEGKKEDVKPEWIKRRMEKGETKEEIVERNKIKLEEVEELGQIAAIRKAVLQFEAGKKIKEKETEDEGAKKSLGEEVEAASEIAKLLRHLYGLTRIAASVSETLAHDYAQIKRLTKRKRRAAKGKVAEERKLEEKEKGEEEKAEETREKEDRREAEKEEKLAETALKAEVGA